jgi:biopolymer transport protein ExbB/TolQ
MKKYYTTILMFVPAIALFFYFSTGGISNIPPSDYLVLAVYIILSLIADFSLKSNNSIFSFLKKQDEELTTSPEINHLFSTIWKEFITKKEMSKTQLNISSFIEMFMAEYKIDNQSNMIKKLKLIHTYASISILVGVLGTFIGLVVTLASLNPDNIDSSIMGILGGVHTAFFTSIGGILFSIVINLHSKYKNSEQLLLQVMLKIENHIYQKDQKTSDYYVVEALGDVKEAIRNVGRVFLDVATFSKEFKIATDSLIGFNETFQKNTIEVNNMFTNMKTITEQFNNRTSQLHSDFEKLFTYFENQNNNLYGMKTAFEQSRNDIKTFINDQSKVIEQISYDNKTVLEQVSNDNKSVLEQVSNDNKSVWEQISNENKTVLEQISNDNKTVQQQYETMFKFAQNVIKQAYKELHGFFEQASLQISQIATQNESQVDTHKQLTEAIYKQIKKEQAALLKQIKESNAQNSEVKESIKDSVLKIEGYLGQQERSNETLTKQLDQLSQSIQSANDLIVIMNGALTKGTEATPAALKSLESTLNDLRKSIETLSKKVNEEKIQYA